MWYQIYIYQKLIKRSASLCLLAVVSPVMANPTGGQVVGGSASIKNGATTVVTQHTHRAIVNWEDFSIGKDETTRFVQPSSKSVILNRVTGNNISQILGNLTANGQVFLVNRNGIVFGKTARVDVAGLVASTADISNADFMKGNYHFTNAPEYSSIINEGMITIRDAGLAALVAPNVQNSGIIEARLGRVALAAGTAFTVDLYGDNLISFDASSIVSHGNVSNLGRINAAGGTVALTAAAADALVENMVNMSGYISATTVGENQGKIILRGYGNTNIDVSGTIDVSALQRGNAGEIMIFSDGATKVTGQLYARGGTLSGNGGFIETSGQFLDVSNAFVSASAPYGSAGTWFLDPIDITVDNATASTYSSVLGAGTNLTINATNNIYFTNNLTPVSWSTNADFRVEAGNNIDINTGTGIAIDTTGTGTVTLYSDYDNSGDGTVTFTSGSAGNAINAPSGNVQFFYNPSTYPFDDSFLDVTAGSFYAYMLVHDATDLQNINLNTSGIYALAGNITTGLNNFTPIAFFEGTFNGQGYTLSGLTINLPTTDDVGLFSSPGVANIYHFSLINSTIIGQNYVGAIAGQTFGFLGDPSVGTRISNVYSNATVTGNNNVGGIVGSLGIGGELTDALYSGTVTGNDSVGGLAGSLDHITAQITTSVSLATLQGNSNVGGVLGSNNVPGQQLDNVYASTGISGLTTLFTGPAVGFGDSTGSFSVTGFNLTTIPSTFNLLGSFWQSNGSAHYISLISCGSSCVIPVIPNTSNSSTHFGTQYVTVNQILNNNILTTTPTLVYYSDSSLMYSVPLSTGDGIYVMTVVPEENTKGTIENALDALKSAYGCNTSI